MILAIPITKASSFQQYLLAEYINVSATQIGLVLIIDLKEALEAQDLERFITILNSVFAGIPHTLFLPQEAYYHSIIYLTLKLLGFVILAEPLTSNGRIDAVLQMPDRIYSLEFKMRTSQIALDQIKARGYDQPYRASSKPITLLGIAFDKEKRAIGEWVSE